MTLNNPKGTNTRGREIPYEVYDTAQNLLFEVKGKRFNPNQIVKECQARKIKGTVIVKWERNNRWGFDFQNKVVKITSEEGSS